MNQTFYLFRHALATRSKNGYGDKIFTAEILQEETGPIKKMAEYLIKFSPSSNFRSELIRCRQTADIITKITGKNFISDNRLNEYHQESFINFRNRIHNWLKEIITLKCQNIIVCTHGAVIAGLQSFIIDNDFPPNRLDDYPECGELVILKDKKINRINFNG